MELVILTADAAPRRATADNALIDFHRGIRRVDDQRRLIRRYRLTGSRECQTRHQRAMAQAQHRGFPRTAAGGARAGGRR